MPDMKLHLKRNHRVKLVMKLLFTQTGIGVHILGHLCSLPISFWVEMKRYSTGFDL